MPQLAFASTFWESYDALERDVKAGVRKVMRRFQELTVDQLHGKKGVHLESVAQAKDPRIRTVRITGFWRGVVLAPDDGSDVFLLLNILPHDDAYEWAKKRRVSINSATRALEVWNAVAVEELTPALEKAASEAPELLFAGLSDTVLRDLGIDDQLLRAVRTIIDKTQLEAFASLLPEDHPRPADDRRRACGQGAGPARGGHGRGAAGDHARHEGAGVPLRRGGGGDGERRAVRQGDHSA